VYNSKCANRLRHAIRTLILLPSATFWIAGCAPGAVPAGKTPAETKAPSALSQAAMTQPVPPEPASLNQPQAYRLTASVQDLMDGIIDPSADVLWDSVAYIATTKGIEDRKPRTDEEWKAVRTSAITLIEAANLLSMPGRRVAAAHSPPGPGELTHDEIQQRINSTHDAFAGFARNLQDAGLKALAAIDSKDVQGLMDAGGTIDEACEACHVTYWYPNQTRPGS
jgi:cytochrome c556